MYFLKSKDKTLKTFKAFVNMIETLTGLRIRFFRSDRGGEFMSEEFTQFLEERGITRENSAPRTPQQNGVAKRMNQTLLGGARAMVQHAGMTKGFWAEAIAMAAHIINRAPHKSLAWRTPYEVLFGRVPNVSYLRVFGCRAWVFNDQGKKWDPKSKPMTLIGFETGSKAYRLWDPTTRSIVVSANVHFDENVFPHKPKPSAPEVHAQPIVSSSKSPPPSHANYVSVPWFSEDEPEGTSFVHPPPPSRPTSPLHHLPQAHQMPPPASPPLDAPMSTIVEPPTSVRRLPPRTPSPDSSKGKQPVCQGITPSNSKGGLPAPEARARAHKRERLQAEQAQQVTREAYKTKQRVEERARPGGPTEKEAEQWE